MNLFTKEDRSSFPYWFAHWCAFNMTALLIKHWRFRYLFHDFEKPWLRLFFGYSKVQKIHRRIASHHTEFYLRHGWLRWDDAIIDWECSHYTKQSSPLLAREVIGNEVNKLKDLGATQKQIDEFSKNIYKALVELGLDK